MKTHKKRETDFRQKVLNFAKEAILHYFSIIESELSFGTESIEVNLKLPAANPSQIIELRTLARIRLIDLCSKDIEALLERMVYELVADLFSTIRNWILIARQELSLKEILNLGNIEQRAAALKIFGIERLLEEGKAKLIDKSSRGNELYQLVGVFPRTAYFLKYKDPSTGKIFFSGIDPFFIEEQLVSFEDALLKLFNKKPLSKKEFDCKGRLADSAMAWKYGLTLEEYRQLKQET